MYQFKPSFVDRFALGLEDSKFGVRSALGMSPKPYEDMVIVTVDEVSVNLLGRWPWRRDIIADTFANLSEAQIVALDIVFSEESEALRDEYLAEQIYDMDNVILGFFLRDNATQKTTEQALYYLEDCAYMNFELADETVGVKEFPNAEVNIPIIADSGLTCAFFNTEADTDGVYRRYPLSYIHKGMLFPPIAVQTLRYYLNQDSEMVLDSEGVDYFKLGDTVIEDQSYFKLNFYDDVTYISAYDVYSGKVKPEFFQDKIVVVGVTEVGVYDMRPTPQSPITPGVSLHYAAISNLLKDHIIRTAPLLDMALIVGVLLLIFLVSFYKKQYMRWLLDFFIIVMAGFVSYSLFFSEFIWLREFYFTIPPILFMVTLEGFAFFKSEMEALEVKKAFGSYVSPELVEEILSNPEGLELGGQEREISVLFSDIRGFTTLSESLTPTALVSMLNRLLDPMTNVILNNRGMLDKYIGDAMMALFNTPVDVEDHPDKAVLSALELIRCLKGINAEFEKEGIPVVDVGVGINTGTVVVGNMGSRVRFEYTAIGDSVNLASRLEGLCKQYKTRIVISEFTMAKLSHPFLIRRLDRVLVKGKVKPVEIFEPMEDEGNNREIKERFEKALELYYSKDFNSALKKFRSLGDDLGDRTSQVFVERCRLFMEEPPPEDWDGVFTLKTK
ncbi:CHASE2 domain-containing protein [Limisalsivibrio acetivorans]|uniref:CHASE2 domain-containing protein n=1 Tax=Limisalsivibrio acetivorans TaxID=1304888 RepID=UPI0003B40638